MSRQEGNLRLCEINELRIRIPDLIQENPKLSEGCYLYSWLKAKNFNVDNSEHMIREVMKWRREKKVAESVKLEYHADIGDRFKVYVDGFTRSGFCVISANAGRFNFRECIAKHGKEAVVYYWMQLLAKGEKRMFNRAKHLLSTIPDDPRGDVTIWPLLQKNWFVLNMAHMNYGELLSKDVLSLYLTLARFAVYYFPSIEGTLCFVNAGKIMEIFFKLLKPLLSGSNIHLVVFDTNEEKWRQYVDTYIDPKYLQQILAKETKSDKE